jgi:hypothetical protein
MSITRLRPHWMAGLAAPVVVVAASLALAVPAYPQAEPQTVVITSPMQITGIDKAVAAAHGFTIRKNRQGQEYEVTRSGQVVPGSTVRGDCGTSSVSISRKKTGLGYSVTTSFTTLLPAVAYIWTVDVFGPQEHRFTWAGPLIFDTKWTGSGSQNVSRSGMYDALVTFPAYAILAAGGYCEAAHPAAHAYI